MQRPLLLTSKNFKEEVLKSDVPVLVEFWASWCPPCKMMDPMLEELAGEYIGRLKIAKINVDQNSGIASMFSIKGVPTIYMFKDGRAIAERTGAQSKGQLRDLIKDAERGQIHVAGP